MATTSPDNLRTPNPGDPYNLVADLATLASDTQVALNKRVSNLLTGTAAQRVTATGTATAGMLWQDTDGLKMIWRKDGASWVPAVWRWSGTSTQMNGFTQAPEGFEWFNTTDNSDYARVAGSWAPSVVAFDVGLSAALVRSGTAAWAKMPFNSVITDTGGAYNSTLNRFTAPRAGTYEFMLNMVMAVNSGGPVTQFYVNGVSPTSDRASLHYSAAYIGSSAVEILTLNKGDYVEAWLQNANGQSFTVSNLHGTRFTGKLL